MLDGLKPCARYIAAAVAGLVAANGVLGVVDAGVVTQALGLLAALGTDPDGVAAQATGGQP